MRAAIVGVGNELLFGETVDTNAAWLGRWLSARGVAVVRGFTVGDAEADIRDVLQAARAVAELVLVTGGLGPTPDDRTKAAVAGLLGRELVEDPGTRAALTARFRAAGLDEIPPLSRGQYLIPEGATVLRNPEGTAPGLLLSDTDGRIALFPGVPDELRAIVSGDFASVMDGLAGEAVHHRMVRTTGIMETKLAEALEPEIASLPDPVREAVAVAYLPDLLGVDLRLTVRGCGADAADAHFRSWLEATRHVLEPWSYEAESGDLAEAVVHELRRSGRSLAVAESCTGGLVGARVTAIPGASEVFLGGVIVYANEAKVGQVGVAEDDLARHGAVSEPVARQLAAGVVERFGSAAGIGVTGVAGPGGGSEEKPVGTVWIGVTLDGVTEAFRVRYPGDRAAVRERSAQAALAALYRRLRAPRRV